MSQYGLSGSAPHDLEAEGGELFGCCQTLESRLRGRFDWQLALPLLLSCYEENYIIAAGP